MNRLKRLSLMLITILIMIGVCGCMSNIKQNSAEEMKDRALAYLNDLYDDTFTPVGYSPEDWAYDYSTVTFESKKYVGSVIVRIYEDNGKYVFKDNYFELTMKEEAEQFFEDIAKKYDCKVKTKVRFISLGSDNINAMDSFAKYVNLGTCHMEVYFIAGETFHDEVVASILKDICNARIKGIVRFLVTNDEELLSEFSISEIVNEKADSILSKKSYTINSDFQVEE